jgi:hypothetical protein
MQNALLTVSWIKSCALFANGISLVLKLECALVRACLTISLYA